MKKTNHRLYYLVPLMLILVAMAALSACSSGSKTPTPAPTSTPTTSPTPTATLTPTPSPTPSPTPTPTLTSTPSPTTSPTPTPSPTPSPTPTSTPTPTPTTVQNVTEDLKAQGMAFDKSTIRVPAGAKVTIIFTNKDSAPHNFALYTDSSASTPIFVGKVISLSTTTYEFTAPSTPGNYFFRCDVHPTSMTGTFAVE